MVSLNESNNAILLLAQDETGFKLVPSSLREDFEPGTTKQVTNMIPDSTVRYSFATEPVRSLLHDRFCSKKEFCEAELSGYISRISDINCFNKYMANIRVAVVGFTIPQLR